MMMVVSILTARYGLLPLFCVTLLFFVRTADSSKIDDLYKEGTSAFHLNETEEAVPRLKQFLELTRRNKANYEKERYTATEMLAVGLMQLHKYTEAREYFQQLVEQNPESPGTHSGLAHAAYYQGDYEKALKHYQKASEMQPANEKHLLGIGQAYRGLGLYSDAIKAFSKANDILKQGFVPHLEIGITLAEARLFEEAMQMFDQVLALDSENIVALSNKGTILRQLKRWDEAIDNLKKAASLDIYDPLPLQHLAAVHVLKGEFSQAQAIHENIISTWPLTQPFEVLGLIAMEYGDIHSAIGHFKKVLKIKPTVSAHNGLGETYLKDHIYSKAIESFQSALAMSKDDSMAADIYFNLGNAYLYGVGDLLNAKDMYDKTLSILPTFEGAIIQRNILHKQLCMWTEWSQGYPKVVDVIHKQALRIQKDKEWSPSKHQMDPFKALSYNFSVQIHKQIACIKAQSVQWQRNPKISIQKKLISENGKIKLGYISDFAETSLVTLISNILTKHDKSKFDLNVYSLTAIGEHSILEARADNFRDISGISPSKAAQKIAEDGIDILIDLNVYAKGGAPTILAYQPAPIQVSLFGYPATSCAPFYQYIVADEILIPPANQNNFIEKIIYMPHSLFINSHSVLRDQGESDDQSKLGLQDNQFVFCNFEDHLAFNEEIFGVWMNILSRVEKAVIWFLRSPAESEEYLKKEASKRGIDVNRLIFSTFNDPSSSLRMRSKCNTYLDSNQFSSYFIGIDTLWSGTPLVTLIGERMSSRVSASILHAIGCGELVASSLADYEELAVQLALDEGHKEIIKRKISENIMTFPLFDQVQWVKDFEKGLKRVMKDFKEKKSPSHVWIKDEADEQTNLFLHQELI
eukprot:TRINITY_DN6791_c0_g1_i1.p1 TRINITY_DN6791_c0_g1~~TRINITY_DN6791_c0_g1_i1.p1  ORF type:complete len:864 (-),score=198.61 TRINITY_DN6791_c0_g1_i1:67-2658(-)